MPGIDPAAQDGPQDSGDDLIRRDEDYVADEVSPEPDEDDDVDIDDDGEDDDG